LNNWVPLQDQYDCFYFVADWHALTSEYADTGKVVENTYAMVADWIAAGLDPEKSTFFIQSLVPEHAELFLLLSMVVPVSGLERDKKMSKSLGNTIDLADDPDTIKKRVMQMYTDPKRVRADIPGTVEGNPVFVYHDAFNPDTAEVDDLKTRYRAGKVGDVEVKTKLASALNAHLEPIRERRAAALGRPEHLKEILHDGSTRARA